MHPDLERVLFTEEDIQRRTAQLGAQISRDYADKNPLLICILKGAALFLADLVKRADIKLEIDFMATSSYGAASKSSGVVRILKDLERPVEGRHVLIVEDIVDTGLTLVYLRDVLLHRRAASVRVATLFDKADRRELEIVPDYCGFMVPNEFVVGYGLDYAEQYRNLPCVGVLKREIYTN